MTLPLCGRGLSVHHVSVCVLIMTTPRQPLPQALSLHFMANIRGHQLRDNQDRQGRMIKAKQSSLFYQKTFPVQFVCLSLVWGFFCEEENTAHVFFFYLMNQSDSSFSESSWGSSPMEARGDGMLIHTNWKKKLKKTASWLDLVKLRGSRVRGGGGVYFDILEWFFLFCHYVQLVFCSFSFFFFFSTQTWISQSDRLTCRSVWCIVDIPWTMVTQSVIPVWTLFHCPFHNHPHPRPLYHHTHTGICMHTPLPDVPHSLLWALTGI